MFKKLMVGLLAIVMMFTTFHQSIDQVNAVDEVKSYRINYVSYLGYRVDYTNSKGFTASLSCGNECYWFSSLTSSFNAISVDAGDLPISIEFLPWNGDGADDAITNESLEITHTKNVTLTGSLTIDSTSEGGINIASGSDVTFTNFVLVNNSTSTEAINIAKGGSLTIKDTKTYLSNGNLTQVVDGKKEPNASYKFGQLELTNQPLIESAGTFINNGGGTLLSTGNGVLVKGGTFNWNLGALSANQLANNSIDADLLGAIVVNGEPSTITIGGGSIWSQHHNTISLLSKGTTTITGGTLSSTEQHVINLADNLSSDDDKSQVVNVKAHLSASKIVPIYFGPNSTSEVLLDSSYTTIDKKDAATDLVVFSRASSSDTSNKAYFAISNLKYYNSSEGEVYLGYPSYRLDNRYDDEKLVVTARNIIDGNQFHSWHALSTLNAFLSNKNGEMRRKLYSTKQSVYLKTGTESMQLSSNAAMAETDPLTVTGFANVTYDEATKTYSVTVNSDTTKINVIPNLADPNASMMGNYQRLFSGFENEVEIYFLTGKTETIIPLTITSSDGTTTETINLKVIKGNTSSSSGSGTGGSGTGGSGTSGSETSGSDTNQTSPSRPRPRPTPTPIVTPLNVTDNGANGNGTSGTSTPSLDASVTNELDGTKKIEVKKMDGALFKYFSYKKDSPDSDSNLNTDSTAESENNPNDGTTSNGGTNTNEKTYNIEKLGFIINNDKDDTNGSAAGTGDSTSGTTNGSNSLITMNQEGTLQVTNLINGTSILYDVTYDLGNNQKIVIGTLDIKVSEQGQTSFAYNLIDPYGTLKDENGNIIANANVTLYYADTQRNRDANKDIDGMVMLPLLSGFQPNDNKNPQISSATGEYAFMVFPDTDYYIVVTKKGMQTYVSPTISVNKEIVKWDILMNNQKPAIVLATKTLNFDSLAGTTLANLHNTTVRQVGNTKTEIAKLLTYLKANASKDTTIYILGGPLAVNPSVEKAIKDAGYTMIQRVAGPDKYATAQTIAKFVQPVKKQPVILTTGDKISTLFTQVVKANASTNYPLLYTTKNSLNIYTKKALLDLKPSKIYLVGSEATISAAQVKNIMTLLNLKEQDIVWIKSASNIGLIK